MKTEGILLGSNLGWLTFPFLLIVVEQSICNFGDGEQGGAGGEEVAVVLWEWVKGK